MISDQDVFDAAARLRGVVRETPLIGCGRLGQSIGGRVHLKAESLQFGGALKFRGVMNKLLVQSLRPGATLVAYSSGNHAISVAMAARRHRMAAVLVMPEDAPHVKIRRAREEGAEIVFYDRGSTDRVALAEHLCAERAGVLFPPFDDEKVICGQATATLELIEQARAMGDELDHILLPCGGGGMLSGAVLAARAARSRARIWAVEPDGFDCMRQSLRQGRRIENARASGSICDALMAKAPAAITLAIAMEGQCASLNPDDDAVRQAVAYAFSELKLVVEPSGAIALAGLLASADLFRQRSVGVVLSGGNVDIPLFAEILAAAQYPVLNQCDRSRMAADS